MRPMIEDPPRPGVIDVALPDPRMHDYAMFVDSAEHFMALLGGALPVAWEPLIHSPLLEAVPGRLSNRNQRRLVELLRLPADWAGGYSPISATALSFARSLLGRFDLPEPRIFPSEDGGVCLEWTTNDYDISADINDKGTFELHYLDFHSHGDEEQVEKSADDAFVVLARWFNLEKGR